jgi:hypothetical protein
MFFRSPRRFVIVSFIALVFIFGVVQRSPWAQEKVYERMPIFDLGRKPGDQEFLANESKPPEQGHTTGGEAWQNAVPIPAAAPIPTEPAAKVVPPPMQATKEAQPTKVYPPWVTAPSRVGSFIPPTPKPTNMKEYMKKMLQWDRPSWNGHWPPFGDYVNKAYDPNRWERFEMCVLAL